MAKKAVGKKIKVKLRSNRSAGSGPVSNKKQLVGKQRLVLGGEKTDVVLSTQKPRGTGCRDNKL